MAKCVKNHKVEISRTCSVQKIFYNSCCCAEIRSWVYAATHTSMILDSTMPCIILTMSATAALAAVFSQLCESSLSSLVAIHTMLGKCLDKSRSLHTMPQCSKRQGLGRTAAGPQNTHLSPHLVFPGVHPPCYSSHVPNSKTKTAGIRGVTGSDRH